MDLNEFRFVWICPVCGPPRMDPWGRAAVGRMLCSNDDEALERGVELHEKQAHAISDRKGLATV